MLNTIVPPMLCSRSWGRFLQQSLYCALSNIQSCSNSCFPLLQTHRVYCNCMTWDREHVCKSVIPNVVNPLANSDRNSQTTSCLLKGILHNHSRGYQQMLKFIQMHKKRPGIQGSSFRRRCDPILAVLSTLFRVTFRDCFQIGASAVVALLIQRLFVDCTFYLVAYSRGMSLFQQKFSGMDSSLESQNRLCEIGSLTTEPLRSLQQEMSLPVMSVC